MAYDMSLHTFERPTPSFSHDSTHARTEESPPREHTGCRVTNLAIRMSEHSIIKFHGCSKQVQKDKTRHLKIFT